MLLRKVSVFALPVLAVALSVMIGSTSSAAVPAVAGCCQCAYVQPPQGDPYYECECGFSFGGEECIVRPTSCTTQGFCP